MVKVVVCCSKIVQKVCLFGCLLHPYKYFDAAASTPAQQAEEHLSGFVWRKSVVKTDTWLFFSYVIYGHDIIFED